MRRLELLASGEDTADEIFSEYLGPVVARGSEEEVAEMLAAHLADRRTTWHEMVLTALDGTSPAVAALEPAFRASGLSCETTVFGHCPYVALPRSWDAYLGALSSEHRYMAKRSLRDFERWAGTTEEVEVARTYEDLERGKAILQHLHEHRWRTAGRAGVFASPLFRRFHNMLMPALLDRGELDLRWLLANGRPVAVSYCIVHDDRLFFYQGGRATDLPKGVRPGIVLHLRAIRAAIEAGRREYDFLGGDTRYKRELSTATRPLTELRVTRASAPEVARKGLAAGRRILVEARSRMRGRER
jgi:CelD/BcsL family acetyltransferase involved in cellulose biosynthesis